MNNKPLYFITDPCTKYPIYLQVLKYKKASEWNNCYSFFIKTISATSSFPN